MTTGLWMQTYLAIEESRDSTNGTSNIVDGRDKTSHSWVRMSQGLLESVTSKNPTKETLIIPLPSQSFMQEHEKATYPNKAKSHPDVIRIMAMRALPRSWKKDIFVRVLRSMLLLLPVLQIEVMGEVSDHEVLIYSSLPFFHSSLLQFTSTSSWQVSPSIFQSLGGSTVRPMIRGFQKDQSCGVTRETSMLIALPD